MRAQLRTFVGVEAALEQGAEDGRLDGGPVQGGDIRQHVQPFAREIEHGVVIEQPAIEECHLVEAEPAALGHRAEQGAQPFAEGRRVAQRVPHQLREQVVREKVDVLGEQAEQDADQEMGGLLALSPLGAQHLGQLGKLIGCFACHLVGGLRRAECLWLVEDRPGFDPCPRRSAAAG